MKIRLLSVAALVCAIAAPSHAMAAPQDHAHHAALPPAAAPAQRWATDAPLRQGMADIRAAVAALQHYEHGHLGAQQAVTLATQVEGHVAYLVANCKLEPQADAALHGIIAQLMQGSSALKANPKDMAAIATMRQALQDYPRQFDDPGWNLDEAEEK